MNLYLTADQIGTASGGGAVTYHELQALHGLGDPVNCLSRKNLDGPGIDPWKWDAAAYRQIQQPYRLAHVYASTFGDTIRLLRHQGAKIVYTAAAHDVQRSRQEHDELGWPFNYPHLTEPALWQRYLRGYREADALICPSRLSMDVMRKYGCEQPIHVIPHGVTLPEEIKPLPNTFVLGYLGAIGADKGLRSLLQAWKHLNYNDAHLVLAGRDSQSEAMQYMVRQYSGGSVMLVGWLENVADFYNNISAYVQPSISEGYGMEVTEAMAHGRAVLCSDGAGAVDAVEHNVTGLRYEAGNVDMLVEAIRYLRSHWNLTEAGALARKAAAGHTWDGVQVRYQAVWRGLL